MLFEVRRASISTCFTSKSTKLTVKRPCFTGQVPLDADVEPEQLRLSFPLRLDDTAEERLALPDPSMRQLLLFAPWTVAQEASRWLGAQLGRRGGLCLKMANCVALVDFGATSLGKVLVVANHHVMPLFWCTPA